MGVHIQSDIFYSFIQNRIPPYLPEADEQNHIVISAIMKTAIEFSKNKYDVFVDGIFGPWFLGHIKSELLPIEATINYIILRCDLKLAIQRIQSRQEKLHTDAIQQMYMEFENSICHFKDNILNVDNQSIDSICKEILENREKGKYLLRVDSST